MARNPSSPPTISRAPYRAMLLLLLLAFMGALIWAITDLAPLTPGLEPLVASAKEPGGVAHSVTAVLLIFRDYDTLLELTVLLLVLVGVWSLGEFSLPPDRFPPHPILLDFVRLVTPLIILSSLYLVWAGGTAAGGAFQGGAMLGTIGILLMLTNVRSVLFSSGIWPRLTATLGTAIFLSVALIPLLTNGTLLETPPEWMKTKILVLEFPATLSIGMILAALFAGGRAPKDKNENV
jgi:multisubunit Na+/H+ antiporter MnhB subunit